MGRRSHSRSLSIWTNGVRVGRWTIPARGEMELQYDADWLAVDMGRPLSLSLPFNLQNLPVKGEKVASEASRISAKSGRSSSAVVMGASRSGHQAAGGG